MQAVWRQCLAGKYTVGVQAGHPLGFYSHAYAGEVALSRILTDPTGELTALRAATRHYPAPLGDLLGSKRVFLAGLSGIHRGLTAVRGGGEPADAGHRAVRPRGGRSAGVSGDPRHDRGAVPGSGRAGQGDGCLQLRLGGWGSIGLIAGGVITQTVGWHWAFGVNVPIGAVALVLAVRLLAPGRGIGLRQGADVIGAILVTTGLSLGIYTIVQSAEPGVSIRQTLGYGTAAVILLVAFVVRQARATKPLLELRVFGERQISAANIVIVLVFAAGFGFQFLTALYLQRVLDYDSLQTGLAFLPGPVTIGVISLFLSSKLTARFGPRKVLLTGLATFATAPLLLSRAPADGNYLTDVMPVLVLMGAGMGLAIPSLMMLAMSGAKPADAGLASGINNTAQQAGAAVGTATLATSPRRTRPLCSATACQQCPPCAAATAWPSWSLPGSWSPGSSSRPPRCAPGRSARQGPR